MTLFARDVMSPMVELSHKRRIAIVHDALVNTGGAERTMTYMCETFPEAPVFTSVYLPERTYPEFRARQVHVLPGARWVHAEQRAKQLLPLWFLGFRQLDLSSFDVVLSSTTFAAKYICPPVQTRHACYCYAPFRLLWKPETYSPDSLPFNSGLLWLIRPLLRRLDFQVMQAIPRIATSCRNMVAEIYACYRREARVIHPPIRLSDYQVGARTGDYYLSVSRLMSHKRIDLAVQGCQQLGRRLVVVGYGPELPKLEALSDQTIQFVGRVTDAKLRELYTNCRAIIFPSHEDYGLVPLETQASGRPVIAFAAGGVLETVVENQTGVFFKEQTVEAVVEAIQRFEKMQFNPQAIRHAVQRFDVEYFKCALRDFVLSPSL
jgi:glycosyltransferase involved in cell wall biosynthesis